MTLDHLRQKTTLPSRVVKNGLSVLIQHNLVHYFCAEIGRPTFYQAHWPQAYNIVRAGKYAEIVQKRFSAESLKAFEWMQQLGHASIDRVIEAEAKDAKEHNAAIDKKGADEKHKADGPKVNGVNGHGDSHVNGNSHTQESASARRQGASDTDYTSLRRSLDDLISRGYLDRFRYIHTLSDLDATALIEDAIRLNPSGSNLPGGSYTGILNPRQQTDFNAAVNRKKSLLYSTEDLVDPFSEHWSSEPLGQPRSFNSSDPASKSATAKRPRADDADEDVVVRGKRTKKQKLDKKPEADIQEDGYQPEPLPEKPRATITELERKRVLATSDTLFHTNHLKFVVAMRNDALVELCHRRLGHTAARVFGAVLELLEKDLWYCFDPFDAEQGNEDRYLYALPSIMTKEIAASMDAETLASLIPRAATREVHKEGQSPKKEKGKEKENDRGRSDKETIVNEYRPNELRPPSTGEHTHSRPVSKVETSHVHNVARQLDILAAEPHAFIHKVSQTNDRSSVAWKVDYHALVRRMIQFEIENMVQLRFGTEGARVLRILESKGKLDEKQISTLGLMLPKTLRHKLANMHDSGFVDAQEIPRDTTRQPGRTIYLWSYDQDRCRTSLIDDAYKGMARLLQRAREEREHIRILLDKAQRSDVQGREDELLTPGERAALAEWRDKEDKMLVQLARQDSIVTLLRDFLPLKTDRDLAKGRAEDAARGAR